MRSFRSRLLLYGFPLLELITMYVVAQFIGWGWTFLLLLVGIPVGFAVMRNAGDAAMRDLAQAASTGQPVDPSRHTLPFIGGLLIAIPGFWTDLVGALLLVPPVQRLLHRRGRPWLEERFVAVRVPGVHNPGGDVIVGEVVRDDPPHTQQGPPSPGGPPQLSS